MPEEQALNAVQETTNLITDNATIQLHADCHCCSKGKMFLAGYASAFPSNPSGQAAPGLADWVKNPVVL